MNDVIYRESEIKLKMKRTKNDYPSLEEAIRRFKKECGYTPKIKGKEND